ncbi:MAG: biosynthetic arginine decarboxylase, partial [Candidatus Hodarchaeales archaeon]
LAQKEISIKDILKTVHDQMDNPELCQSPSITIRIPQLVEYQIKKIVSSFKNAKIKNKYKGEFLAVYPIKVNQQAHAVQSVLMSKEINYGLEAGTKAEFVITLEALKGKKDHLIMCNGVKDIDYLELAITKMSEGYNIIISVETFRELKTIFEISNDLNSLKLCLRIKPYIPVSGHWAPSSGRNSKFGLSIEDLIQVLDYLEQRNSKSCIYSLHAHIGSQITSMDDFRNLAQHLMGFYNELRGNGFENLTMLDFGGGLPIDYEGRLTPNDPDTFDVYANNLMEGVLSNLDGEPQPDIMIEAGRGITASSSLVVIQILEIQDVFPTDLPQKKSIDLIDDWKKKVGSISTMKQFEVLWDQFSIIEKEIPKLYPSISSLRQHELFVGTIREQFRDTLRNKYQNLKIDKNLDHKAVQELFSHAAKIALCNFSVFNSACDYVLVDQYFPIFPIEFLNTRPDTIIRIADITCDSDGEISEFYTKNSNKLFFTKDSFPISLPKRLFNLKGVPVSNVDGLNESYLVIALTGAYQDVIELDHNLLGDLPDVEVRLDKNGEWLIRYISPSESTASILAKVGYHLPEDYHKIAQSTYAKDAWNRKSGKKE